MSSGEHEGAIATVKALTSDLDAAGIRYVHWKSNNNVHKALAGIDDLDLLVHPADEPAIREVLTRQGYLLGRGPRDSWHPGMSHWFRPDLDSRRMVHVHLHDRLTLGFDFDKNYTLPVVEWYLSGPQHVGGMRLPDPGRELVLFTIRTLVKHARSTKLARLPRGLRSLLVGNSNDLSESERREFHFLLEHASLEDVRRETKASGLNIDPDDLARALETCVTTPASRLIEREAAKLKRALRPYRNRPELLSLIVASARLLRHRMSGAARRLGVGAPPGRKLGEGGRIVAFLGGDGSGKSTNVSELRKLIGRSFRAQAIHVGRPTRSITGLWWAAAGRLVQTTGLRPLGQSLRHIGLAHDRLAAFRRAQRVRADGGLAVLDRLPTSRVQRMDGPRINEASGSWLIARLARRERELYSRFGMPDLLVVIKLDPEVALTRRPEDDPATLRARSGEIWQSDWPEAYAFSVDSGTNDLPAVLSRVTERVWHELTTPFIRTEVVGLSGAGKSSVIRALALDLPNMLTSLPYWSRPLLLLRSAAAQFLARPPRRRSDVRVFKEMAQLRWFIAAHDDLRSPYGRHAGHYVLDQGPAFQLARGLLEGGLSEDHPVFSAGVEAMRDWPNRPLVRLRAPWEVRAERLRTRRGPVTRSMVLEGSEAKRFDRAYREAFRRLGQRLPMVRVDSNRDLSLVVADTRAVWANDA